MCGKLKKLSNCICTHRDELFSKVIGEINTCNGTLFKNGLVNGTPKYGKK